MKREQIAHLLDKKVKFQGTLERYSVRDSGGLKHVTLLFTDVTVEGVPVDHMWVKSNQHVRAHNFKEGSVLKFDCNVEEYCSGFNVGDKRNFEVIKEGDGIDLHSFIRELVDRKVRLHQCFLKTIAV